MNIENNVPAPAIRNRQKWSGFFIKMNIGDSFLIVGELDEVTRCRAAASQFGRLHKMKFSVRICHDHVRCWRVA